MQDNSEWLQQIRQKRMNFDVSQSKLASVVGITRVHLNRIENGEANITEEMKIKIAEALEKLNPDAPLFLLIDYVKIRFSTIGAKDVIEKLLRIKMKYMGHEDYGFYSYTEHYYHGDIVVMVSNEESKGVLLELKGKGCRQFESMLIAQDRDWYEFFNDCLMERGVMKRLDLAVNDRVGILDVGFLIQKCKNEECVSVFRTYKDYGSGELVKGQEQHKAEMGKSLYIGSMKSEVYFCIYEKDYEQYVRNGTPISEAEVKNRFEIRLKNDRAFQAAYDLLAYRDAERTAFSIINRYVRFVDKDVTKRRSEWKVNAQWSWFIGDNREKLKLTTEPEPYTVQKTRNWMRHQVAASQKMLMEIDKRTGSNCVEEMLEEAELTEKHQKIIEQTTCAIEEMIL